jgi:hypothetical protein
VVTRFAAGRLAVVRFAGLRLAVDLALAPERLAVLRPARFAVDRFADDRLAVVFFAFFFAAICPPWDDAMTAGSRDM